MQIIFSSQIFPSTKICSQNPACGVIQTCFVTIGHHSSILDDTHNAYVSNAKYRGQLGVAIGQEQVRVLLVGRTSNSPEAVHSHLKDQSQWSHQAHLFLPPLLRVGPSVQIRDGPLFFWRGDEKLSSAKFFNIYVCRKHRHFLTNNFFHMFSVFSFFVLNIAIAFLYHFSKNVINSTIATLYYVDIRSTHLF